MSGLGFPRRAARDRGGVFFKLLVLLAVLFAAAALAWMLFLPEIFAARLHDRTGFGVKLHSLVAIPFTGRVELRGLTLSNPAGFPVRDFLELRELRVKTELTSVFSDRPVFEEVVLDVAGITVVKPAAGRTNAEAFQQGVGAPESNAPATGAARPAPRFLIRRLTLRFDRLVIADHSGSTPVVREVDVGLNRTFTNVTDLKPLVPAEVWQSLAPVGAVVGELVPNDLGHTLRAAARDAARTGAERLREAGQKTGEKVKGFLEALEESKKP
jgi:hypothetical protein